MVVPQQAPARQDGRQGRSDFERGFQYLYEVFPLSIAYLVLDRPCTVLCRESTGLPEKPGRLDTLLRVRLPGERRSRRLIVDFKDRWRGQRTAGQLVGYAAAIQERHGEWPLVAALCVQGPSPDAGWSPRAPVWTPAFRLDFQCQMTCLSHLEARRFIERAPAPALILAGAMRGITPALMQRALRRMLQRIRNREVRENLLFYAGVFCTRINPRHVRLKLEGGLKSPFGEMMRKCYKEGQLKILLCMIRDRFGRVPARTRAWIESRTDPQLERLACKLLTATSLADLGPPRRRNGAGR